MRPQDAIDEDAIYAMNGYELLLIRRVQRRLSDERTLAPGEKFDLGKLLIQVLERTEDITNYLPPTTTEVLTCENGLNLPIPQCPECKDNPDIIECETCLKTKE